MVNKEFFEEKLKSYHAIFPTIMLSSIHCEYLMGEACKLDGKIITKPTNWMNPGEDITIDSRNISIKTETSKTLNSKKIKISKLLEASWWTDIPHGNRLEKIKLHLSKYDAILMLRGFQRTMHYELWEIPISVFGDIENAEWSVPTCKGTQSAKLKYLADHITLRYDGTARKMVVENLPVFHCIKHWTINLQG